MQVEAERKPRPELWVVATWALLALEFALAVYLGMKKPGVAPVRAYLVGPQFLVLGALGLGIGGLVWSAMRRPFLNSQRMVGFCLLGFVIATCTYPLPFPSYRAGKPSSVKVHLPVEGEWTVAWGGEGDMNFVVRTRPDRCFGFVLVKAENGLTRKDPNDPKSARAFGEQVNAPCDGTLVRVVDDYPDDASAPDDLGNYVVLEIAPDEYLFLAGLAQHSLAAKLGDHVTRGAPLARVGFSASSLTTPEPHLSIHVQSTPDPFEGQGVPFYFHDISIDGQALGRGVPSGAGLFVGRSLSGQRIANGSASGETPRTSR